MRKKERTKFITLIVSFRIYETKTLYKNSKCNYTGQWTEAIFSCDVSRSIVGAQYILSARTFWIGVDAKTLLNEHICVYFILSGVIIYSIAWIEQHLLNGRHQGLQ